MGRIRLILCRRALALGLTATESNFNFFILSHINWEPQMLLSVSKTSDLSQEAGTWCLSGQ